MSGDAKLLDHYKLSKVLTGHRKDVRSVCTTSDHRVVTGSRDNTVRVWDLFKTGTEIPSIVLTEHQHFVGALTPLKPNDQIQRMFASGANDKCIYVWDSQSISRDQNLANKLPSLLLSGHTDTISSLGSTSDGLVISGSWDKTVKIWNNADCVQTLEKHEAAVWGVLGLPNGNIVTASADKKIIVWQRDQTNPEKVEYKSLNVLTKHTDCVRGLALIPDFGFVSCGNDGLIAVWTFSGELIGEMTGHSGFVYNVAVVPNFGYVSCSEDRSVKIWKSDDNSCHQTIAHPSGVWCVATLANGDIVTGCADGVARVFTRNPSRVAVAELIEQFHQSVAAQEIPADNVGDIKLNELPEVGVLVGTAGKKDGEMKVVRNGKVAEAHQWSESEQRWIKIGDVIDSNQSKSKALLNGAEYDYVFDIDVNEGTMYKIGYNNGQNPYTVAQEFLWKNDLDQSWLEEIAQFLIKNANAPANTIGPQESTFSDPFTGGNRYVPGTTPSHQMDMSLPSGSGGGSGQQQQQQTTATSDLSNLASKFGPAPTADVQSTSYIPHGTFTYFDATNSANLVPKLLEYNTELLANPDTAKIALNIDENEDNILKSILNTLKETSRYHSSNFSDAQYKVIIKLFKWPTDKLLPLLDIIRVMVYHPNANNTFEKMITMRQFNIFDALFRIPATDNINTQMMISYSTLLLNLSVSSVYNKDTIKVDVVDLLIRSLESMILKEIDHVDVLERATLALGTLLITFRDRSKAISDKEILAQIIRTNIQATPKFNQIGETTLKLLQ
ncbi:hypothetical protein PPL_09428 [Heterostelium album PN500]|uniref:Phospholipase A-2-activating protein n=1 Tax=Heterostelium pallidum (strain ATCC 26659 / Pp 5 / PN500) TaxID=670386 RepID=D3BPG0_HETP5|nr:hypothetical protein PPL_09428 [Heterostelium album PN500]EFA76678.1 hypothetical protein PPL_09428 [Heterostelium album PN500]|eukprot:XP_020428810.1 hypothetical protein PPL_09428 [Heterostelium album PN500]